MRFFTPRQGFNAYFIEIEIQLVQHVLFLSSFCAFVIILFFFVCCTIGRVTAQVKIFFLIIENTIEISMSLRMLV